MELFEAKKEIANPSTAPTIGNILPAFPFGAEPAVS
jgi:hypothetical protein